MELDELLPEGAWKAPAAEVPAVELLQEGGCAPVAQLTLGLADEEDQLGRDLLVARFRLVASRIGFNTQGLPSAPRPTMTAVAPVAASAACARAREVTSPQATLRTGQPNWQVFNLGRGVPVDIVTVIEKLAAAYGREPDYEELEGPAPGILDWAIHMVCSAIARSSSSLSAGGSPENDRRLTRASLSASRFTVGSEETLPGRSFQTKSGSSKKADARRPGSGPMKRFPIVEALPAPLVLAAGGEERRPANRGRAAGVLLADDPDGLAEMSERCSQLIRRAVVADDDLLGAGASGRRRTEQQDG